MRPLAAALGGIGCLFFLSVTGPSVHAQVAESSLVQEAFLKASNSEAGDFFGWSVVIDGNTAAVGAVGERGDGSSQSDNSRGASGAVYVFVKSGGIWVQQAYLKSGNIDIEDGFGLSLALSGDRLVVGAPYEDSAATGIDGDGDDNLAPDAGAAYVFTRSGATWTQEAYLKASNTETGDQFGHSVAIDGDRVLVGAWLESSNAVNVDGDQSNNDAPEAGAVYAFQRTGSAWAQTAYIKASNSGEGDWFGVSVSLDAGTAVVGALYEDSDATGIDGDGMSNLAPDSGAAYVFTLVNSAWAPAAYLKASNTDEGGIFGASVAISEDTILIGAPWEASNAMGMDGDQLNDLATDSGAAYLFTCENGAWSQTHFIKASNSDAYDSFGVSVALDSAHAVVAAYGEDGDSSGIDGDQSGNTGINSGAVYRFAIGESGWEQVSYLKASNSANGGLFGFNVSVSGESIIVGTPYEATGGTTSGGAYLFSMQDLIGVFSLSAAGPTKIKPTFVRKRAKAVTYRISNTGNGELGSISVTLSGKHRKDYLLSGPSLRTLAPGQSTTFSVTFKPKAKGVRKAVIAISSARGGAAVNLKGKGR